MAATATALPVLKTYEQWRSLPKGISILGKAIRKSSFRFDFMVYQHVWSFTDYRTGKTWCAAMLSDSEEPSELEMRHAEMAFARAGIPVEVPKA